MDSSVIRAFDWLVSVCFGTGLIALPFLIVNWFYYVTRRARARRDPSVSYKFPIKSVLFFSVPLLTALCVGSLSKSMAQEEVLSTLRSLTRDARIFVNGNPVEDSGEILSALKTIHWVYPHHSSPSNAINRNDFTRIEICDHSRHIVLLLGRDSGDRREYWVFYPKYHITTGNEIGRVITPVFDAYWPPTK
jgi:hypothetical protein